METILWVKYSFKRYHLNDTSEMCGAQNRRPTQVIEIMNNTHVSPNTHSNVKQKRKHLEYIMYIILQHKTSQPHIQLFHRLSCVKSNRLCPALAWIINNSRLHDV